MADLDDAPHWVDGIYRFEATDPIAGGEPNRTTKAGIDNVPHLELANRTKWLRERIESLPPEMDGAQILAKLLAFDGPGSGLDADLLDGFHAAAFQRPALTQPSGNSIERAGSWNTLEQTGFFAGEGLVGETPFREGNGRVAVLSIAHPGGPNRFQLAAFRERLSFRTFSTGVWQPWRLLVSHEQGNPPPFALSYESPELVIQPGGRHTLAHGLGRAPRLVVCELVCRTGQHGHQIGDRLGPMMMAGTLDGDTGVSHSYDAAEIKLRLGAAADVFATHGTSGQRITLSNANWRLVVRAHA